MNNFTASFKEAWLEFWEDGAHRMAAALSFFTTFSLAPMLVVMIAVGSIFMNKEALQQQVMDITSQLISSEAAQLVGDMINASTLSQSPLMSLLSIAFLLFGATTIFYELRTALNHIWGVESPESSLMKRVMSFVYMLVAGAVVLGLVLLNSLLPGYIQGVAGDAPGVGTLAFILTYAISFGVLVGLFSVTFKYLPDSEVAWDDVTTGAAVTSVAFLLGQFVVRLYIQNSSVTGVYGSAGALAVMMVWIFYIYIITLGGAEFTQVYAHQYGTLTDSQIQKEPAQERLYAH
jgi:membrane protein